MLEIPDAVRSAGQNDHGAPSNELRRAERVDQVGDAADRAQRQERMARLHRRLPARHRPPRRYRSASGAECTVASDCQHDCGLAAPPVPVPRTGARPGPTGRFLHCL